MPIVPVIAKADTMTVSETDDFRKLVRDELAKKGVPLYDWVLPNGQIDPKINDSIINDKPAPPFTLIADKSKKRVYEWGTCEQEDRNHSDFMLLKDLVIKEHLDLMRQKAYDIYDTSYRKPRFTREFGGGLLPPMLNRWCIRTWDQIKSTVLGEMETLPLAELIFVFFLGSQLGQVLSWCVTERVGSLDRVCVCTTLVLVLFMMWELYPRYTREAARLKLEQHTWEGLLKVLGKNRAAFMIISLVLGVLLGFWHVHSFAVSSRHIVRTTEVRLQAAADLGRDCESRLEQVNATASNELIGGVAVAEKKGAERLEEEKAAASKKLVEELAAAEKQWSERLEQEMAAASKQLAEKVAENGRLVKETKRLNELLQTVNGDAATCTAVKKHIEQEKEAESKKLVDKVAATAAEAEKKTADAENQCGQRLKQEKEVASKKLMEAALKTAQDKEAAAAAAAQDKVAAAAAADRECSARIETAKKKCWC